MQKRLKLAAIEVSPHSFIRMIVNWQQLTTDRTWPFLPLGMLDKHINLLCFDGQIDFLNSPRRFKSQKMTVKIGIVHDSPLSEAGV